MNVKKVPSTKAKKTAKKTLKAYAWALFSEGILVDIYCTRTEARTARTDQYPNLDPKVVRVTVTETK